MDIGDVCEHCKWYNCGEIDCMSCPLGNPCLGCDDYDALTRGCKSNGGCGANMKGEENG